MQAAGAAVAGQRPEGDAVVGVRGAVHAGIGLLGCAQQVVGADRQRFGQPGQMVEGQPALARFQPAQRGDVDAGAGGHVLQVSPR